MSEARMRDAKEEQTDPNYAMVNAEQMKSELHAGRIGQRNDPQKWLMSLSRRSICHGE